MKRKLVALMVLLAGLSLAQSSPDRDSHNVTVTIPPFLKLTLDATDYVFNFGSNTGSNTSGNVLGYPRASSNAYETFLNDSDSSPTQLFAPSAVTGGTADEYGTLTVLTNQAQWTVKIDSIGGTLPSPLANNRVKVFADRASGKGSSQTSAPTAIAANLALAQATSSPTSSGAGKSVYKLYYFFEMNASDEIPSGGLSGQISLTLIATAP